MSVKQFSFSKKQQQALSMKRENMLVSAGAGSGKTAVLVERIVRLISEENVELDRLLVLTFTRDGAEEFKTRIKKSLSVNPKHAHKAFALDNADITTIDAFSLKIVKKYGYLQNLDPHIINMDEQIESVLLRRSFDNVMSKLYDKPTTAFINYAKRFLLKNDEDLFQMMINLHRQTNLALNREDFLNNFLTKYYDANRFKALLNEITNLTIMKLRQIASLIKTLEDERHSKAYEPFLESFGAVLTFDDFLLDDDLTKPARRPNKSYELYPNDEPIVGKIKALFEELQTYKALGSSQNMLNVFNENKAQAEFVINVYREVIAEVNAYKALKNAYTFSDIARLAFNLVKIPEVKSELQHEYKYILIDEYQDTSDIQEAFIQEIATDNVYMVGDIKQSIYMFRNANSDIFNAKYARYRANDGGTLVDLNDNYRSRPEVLSAINSMLAEIMSVEVGGANYRKEHMIGYGNKVYDNHKIASQKTGLKVLNYDMPTDDMYLPNELKLSQAEIEADIIINDIKRKLATEFKVLDKDKAGKPTMRPVKYSDFTILISRTTHFEKIERRFVAAGIPFFQNKDEILVDDKVIIALNALLRIFVYYTLEENPNDYNFRFAIASFLRSFINNYSDQALLDLLGNNNRDFTKDIVLGKVRRLALELRDEPVALIVNTLVTSFDFYNALNRIGNVVENTYKLMNHIAKVNDLATLQFSLKEIVDYFEAIKTQKLQTSIKRPKLDEDSVTLMTIHKSKGLEFPIVYYMDIEQDFFRRENSDIQLAVDDTYGFTMLSPGPTLTMNYILSKARKAKLILSERIRLLYVALTRAKEKMIIIHKNDEKSDANKPFADAKTFKELLFATNTYREAMEYIELQKTSTAQEVKVPTYSGGNFYKLKTHPFVFSKQAVDVSVKREVHVSEALLARGTLLHKYIEIYDFNERKLDYILNKDDREHIRLLLALPIFKSATAANVYREYDFIDQITNKTYVIDMFILGAREILLFDFKLVNIDEPNYDLQVQNYAKYLSQVFKRPVSAYLVSIINLNYRKVEVHAQ